MFERGGAFLDASFGEPDMRQRMLRPRVVGNDVECVLCGLLGFAQQMKLFERKGAHSMNIRCIGRSLDNAFGSAEHLGEGAAIEQMIMEKLEREQIARMLFDYFGQPGDDRVDVGFDPVVEYL